MDDVVIAKAAIVERCVARAREELAAASEFAADFTRQDAAILNVERACEAAIDIAFRIVRQRGLGAPANNREAFETLTNAGLITLPMLDSLKRMVGFRNVAIHQYDKLDITVTETVIREGLDDLLAFSALALRL